MLGGRGGKGRRGKQDEWRWETLAAEQTHPQRSPPRKQEKVVKLCAPHGSILAPLRTTLGSPLENPSIMDNRLLSSPPPPRPGSISIAQKCASLMETLCWLASPRTAAMSCRRGSECMGKNAQKRARAPTSMSTCTHSHMCGHTGKGGEVVLVMNTVTVTARK